MIEVKELKKELENLLAEVEQLPRTRELSLVITKLEEGLMWLEKSIKKSKQKTASKKKSNHGRSLIHYSPKN